MENGNCYTVENFEVYKAQLTLSHYLNQRGYDRLDILLVEENMKLMENFFWVGGGGELGNL
jgi:hypothetical protein